MFPKPPSPPKLPSPPPLSAQFQSKLEPSQPGTAPKQQGWNLIRSSDGKMRIDQGNQSLITNPSTGQTIRLDHVNKEAQVFPMSGAPAKPGAPSGGAPSFTPPKSPLNVKDLGKRMIAGHEVEGKSYTYPAPQPPSAPGSPKPPNPSSGAAPPGVPGLPKPPKLPGVPGLPKPPNLPSGAAPPGVPGSPKPPNPPSGAAAPNAPPPPHTLEVWTSPKLQLPLATRLTGGIGKQTTITKQVTPGEPPASAFQIPPGYKLVPPPHAPAPST